MKSLEKSKQIVWNIYSGIIRQIYNFKPVIKEAKKGKLAFWINKVKKQ